MKCKKTGFEITPSYIESYCKDCWDKCSYYQNKNLSYLNHKVDPFELARLLKAKKQAKEKNEQAKSQIDIFENVIWLTDDEE